MSTLSFVATLSIWLSRTSLAVSFDTSWMEQPAWEPSFATTADNDYDAYPFVTDSSVPSLVVYPPWTGTFIQTQSNATSQFSAFVAQINNNTKLSFVAPDFKCSKMQKTSATAAEYNCSYATNAGYYTYRKPHCLPQFVSNGVHVTVDYNASNPARASIGLDVQTKRIAVGYIALNASNVNSYLNFLSGYGWLVRNGNVYVNQSTDIDVSTAFVQEKAPRTGLGVYRNGSMVLLQVDGVHDMNYGMDLWEFSELFVRLGVDSAINFDGGGSSTSVDNGQVINNPTCSDTRIQCERPVTSIVCVKA